MAIINLSTGAIEVLLIAQEWKPRVLIRAQLSEEGYEVVSSRTIEEAMALLCRGLARPELIILDTHGQGIDERVLTDLRELAGDTPILVCSGPFNVAGLDLEIIGFEHLLVRPFTIRDVVEKAGQVLRRDSGERGNPDEK